MTQATSFEVFLPFGKIDRKDDGTILVHTRLNDETVDDQGEVVTFEAVEKASADYMKWANVREMHQGDTAAGTMVSLTPIPEERAHEAILHIVDPVAVQKVSTGVYKGTSLGGAKRRIQLGKVGGQDVRKLVEIDWRETSLVDRPSRPTAVLSLLKRSDVEDVEMVTEEIPEGVAGEDGPEIIVGAPDVLKASVGDVYIGAEPDPVTVSAPASEPLVKRDIPDSERADMSSSDFAGKGTSFPIKEPGDVAAAARSIGRAGPGNFSGDKIKANIIRIARRKGAAFVAKLPQSWTEDTAKVSGIEDLAKSADDDVQHAAAVLSSLAMCLGCINDLLSGEAEEAAEGEDEAADIAWLEGARDAILSAAKGVLGFMESESSEVGTPEDVIDEAEENEEQPSMAMAYASVIADLAKGSAPTPEVERLRAALGALVPLAKGSEIPLAEVGSVEILNEESLQKLGAAVQASLGALVTREDMEAVKATLSTSFGEVRETLAKIAAQPVAGGPLRYAGDARRFTDGDPLDTGTPEAKVLAKVAETFPVGSPEREALGKAAATQDIRTLLRS